jgi:hypothetical protein
LPRSQSGGSWSDSIPVSSVGHQPQYEMFGNRDIPFHGDYNRISLADSGDPDHPLFADESWTDNRDVVPSTDPREIEEQEGFDVLRCRVDLAEDTQSRDDGPLARRALYRRQLRRPRPGHLRQLPAPPVA